MTTKTHMTSCIDKIEPLTKMKQKEYICIHNETNRKISRLDRIDKKLNRKQTKIRTGSNKDKGGEKPAGGDISSCLYVIFFYNFFLSYTHRNNTHIINTVRIIYNFSFF